MKKVFAIVLLLLSGCVIAPTRVYPVGYTTDIAVDPACCVVFQGVSGFWFGGRFYESHYWAPGFRGGVPYRFVGPVHGGRGHR